MNNELIEKEAVPSFLQSSGGQTKGTEQLGRYIRPSFTKIVQSNSKDLKKTYPEGTLLSHPEKMVIADPGQAVIFVPIFFFPEFCLHNAYPKQPFIRERSLDPESSLAKRCRQRSKESRTVSIEGDSCEYCEHLNFVVVFPEVEEFAKKPVVISLFKGEWTSGNVLASLIDSRVGMQNICGNRFQFRIVPHQGGGNEWLGWCFENPATGGKYITNESQYHSYVELQKKVEEAFSANALEVDHEEGSNVETDNGEFA